MPWRMLGACWLTTLIFPSLAPAQERANDPWIGQRVFTQFGTVLKVNNNVVDDEGRTASVNASGKDRKTSRVYRVEHVNGEWLWLQDETSGIAGWVQSKYVIPYDQAIDHYTDQIRANPRASLFNSRGLIWSARKEYDIAIADYNEAIRLDPNYASAYYNRGNDWGHKMEYDIAIADYNEAIRLDPNYASAYYNRGVVWGYKKEYDKIISDYTEAIRLDSKDALAYNGRGNAWQDKKEYDKAISDYNEAIRLDPKDASAYNGRAWLWATCPDAKYRDGARSVESATTACKLSDWKAAYNLGTLAAACAEAGDFARAVKWQEKAVAMHADGADRQEWVDRLKLYQDQKPYRDVD